MRGSDTSSIRHVEPHWSVPLDPHFANRKDHALALLSRHGVHRFHAAPPLFHLLWRLGIEIPPPHFRSRSENQLVFTAILGALLSLFQIGYHLANDGGIELPRALVKVTITTTIASYLLASYFSRSARKLNLPRFSDLPTEPVKP